MPSVPLWRGLSSLPSRELRHASVPDVSAFPLLTGFERAHGQCALHFKLRRATISRTALHVAVEAAVAVSAAQRIGAWIPTARKTSRRNDHDRISHSFFSRSEEHTSE